MADVDIDLPFEEPEDADAGTYMPPLIHYYDRGGGQSSETRYSGTQWEAPLGNHTVEPKPHHGVMDALRDLSHFPSPWHYGKEEDTHKNQSTMERAKEKGQELVDSAKEKAEEFKEKGQELFESAKEKGQELMDSGKKEEKVEESYNWWFHSGGEKAKERRAGKG